MSAVQIRTAFLICGFFICCCLRYFRGCRFFGGLVFVIIQRIPQNCDSFLDQKTPSFFNSRSVRRTRPQGVRGFRAVDLALKFAVFPARPGPLIPSPSPRKAGGEGCLRIGYATTLQSHPDHPTVCQCAGPGRGGEGLCAVDLALKFAAFPARQAPSSPALLPRKAGGGIG